MLKKPAKKATRTQRQRNPEATRARMLEATITLLRSQGYHGTGIDAICKEAEITKGAFFHHFPSKEAIAQAALDTWCQNRVQLYAQDLGDSSDDPLVRLRRFIEGLAASVSAPGERAACVLGMISQELAGSNEQLRQACEAKLRCWTQLVASLLTAAKARHPTSTNFDPEQVAWMLNSLWQGTLLTTKTLQDPQLATRNLRQFLSYLDFLFPTSATQNPS